MHERRTKPNFAQHIFNLKSADEIRERASNQLLAGPDKKETIDLNGGRINDPMTGKHYSPTFLLATP